MKPTCLLAAVALMVAARAPAQVPAGGEFVVNTYTTHSQDAPTLAFLKNGDFVIVWTSWGQDGDRNGVFAQRFDATGGRRGGEFQVNTSTAGLQSFRQRHDVAVDDGGNFVIVWSSHVTLPGPVDVFGRRFSAAGVPFGAEFRVSNFASYLCCTPQKGPRVAMAPTGSFVVAWDSAPQDGDSYGIFARRFDAAGSPLGAPFQVNTYTTNRQVGANIDMDAAGNFVVVWTGYRLTTKFDVFAQRFDAQGNRLGGEFQVNAYSTGNQGYHHDQDPKVAVADDGRFLVTWNDSGRWQMMGQRFDAAGAAAGAEIRLDSTAVSQFGPTAVESDSRGNFVVTWADHDGFFDGITARRFTADGDPRGPQFRVNSFTTGQQNYPGLGLDDVGNFVVAWDGPWQDGGGNYGGILAERFGGLRSQALAVDAAGNRVLDPAEMAIVQPAWRNINGAALTFGGVLAELTGPAGPTYTLTDGIASYGTVANAATGACTDCYTVQVSGPRPATHWDASAVETITPDTLGQQKQWVLHVGGSFSDVSAASPFYRFIETLLHRGVTGGCAATAFCPSASTSRAQMAVFALVAKEGPGYAPPACVAGQEMFSDLPASSPFCRWVEELARRGVVSGCGGGQYCPVQSVIREQMAIFALATLEGPSYQPPACGTPMYADVPAGSPFCRWIEELTRRGVVSGCGGGNFCPGDGVTREQMSVFLGVTFGLTLYGP